MTRQIKTRHKLPRFSPHNGGENLRPAIIHYKADKSPITEKIVRVAVRLLGSTLIKAADPEVTRKVLAGLVTEF